MSIIRTMSAICSMLPYYRLPEGVMLTHYNGEQRKVHRLYGLTADRLMIHVPMFHCFGMVLATAAMTHGVTMSPIPYFTEAVPECINRERLQHHGVPTMFIAMMGMRILQRPTSLHEDRDNGRKPCPRAR